MRVRLIATAVLLGAGVALSGVGCATSEPRYEDCEVSDQEAREPDCGYYERGGDYRLSSTPLDGWAWVWWSWVTPGQSSFPPSGWKPPHGLRPPTESKATEKRRKQHEKKTSNTTVRSTPRKSTGGGTVTDGRSRRTNTGTSTGGRSTTRR